MNEAWISPSAGCAVVAAEDGLFLLEACRPSPPWECLPGRLQNLLQLSSEVIQMPAGDFPFPDVQQSLDASWRIDSALKMILMALDRTLSPALRGKAAEVAEDLLVDEETRTGVRRRLLAVPLPEVADVAGAFLGEAAGRLASEAQTLRDLVVIANDAWEQTFFGLFTSAQRQSLRRASTLQGGGAALVDALRIGDASLFENWRTDQVREEREGLGERRITDLLSAWGDAALKLYTAAIARDVVRLLPAGDPPGLGDLEGFMDSLPLEVAYEFVRLRPKIAALSPKARIGLLAHLMSILEVGAATEQGQAMPAEPGEAPLRASAVPSESGPGPRAGSSSVDLQATDLAIGRKEILSGIDVGVAECVA